MEGNATEFAATMLAFTVALVPLTGIMTIVTPFLMRRGEVFAVTVPDTAAHDPYLRRLKRCYALIMSALTAVLTAVGAFGAFTGDAGLALAVLCVGMLLLCVGSYGLMLYFRAKVQSYKKEQGWQASARESVAVVGDAPVPRAVSLKWNLLYLPVIAVTLAIGAVGYAQMPDLIPQHMNFQGEVTEYMEANYPDMLRSASVSEVAGFFIDSLLGIDREDGYYKFEALQIPTTYYNGLVYLGSTRLINRAHEYDIAVQYWTINDAETVAELSAKGADAIMTDYPDMAWEVLNGAN